MQGDYTASTPNLTGRYLNNGFSITMYGVPLDEYDLPEGAGDLVNLEFYPEAPDSPDFSVAGTYTYYDTEGWMNKTNTVKFGPGDLMGGFLYEMMPGYAFPLGTMITVYDEDLSETIGLAGPSSTLVVTDKGDGIYNLSLHMVTFQSANVTAEWEGPLAEYVDDFPTPTDALSSINVYDGDVEYYNMQGVKVANPEHGKVYITVKGGKASKMLFR